MIKLLEILNEESEMDSEDLENCDEYPLPDWWDNDDIELISIKKDIQELEFDNKGEFQSYSSQHSIRDTTKVKIGGQETTAGAVKKDDAVKKVNPKAMNPIFKKKYGKLNLSAYPPMGVDEKDVKVNTENLHTHAVLQWKDPASGRTMQSYTKRFLEKNAKVKWKRIQRIKPEYVDRIYDKAINSLKSRKSVEREVGAIIAIITKTGLRPGSLSGFDNTGNRGVSTLSADNITIDGDKIIINFVGKSYKPNNATIKDKILAKYLSKRINERKGEKFLFDVNDGQVRTVFKNKIGRKGMKVKDLRTYTATAMASTILKTNNLPPLPLPDNDKDLKKLVKIKLDDVFNKVSKNLNNTPAMAKSSYVHPKIIEQWMKEIGIENKV